MTALPALFLLLAAEPASATGVTLEELILLLAAEPASATGVTLEELNRAYQQACDTRAYGQFDDVCGGLRDQIARYRADLRRRPPPKSAAAPAPAAVPPEAVGATTAAAHDPLKVAPPK